MTAMARHLDNLGPDFDQRWKRSTRGAKRELIGELRELYIFLEEDDMPLLAGKTAAPATEAEVEKPKAAPRKKAAPETEQGSLFNDSTSTAASPVIDSTPAGAPRQDNPFLPKSVLDRLHDSQNQASAGLRELMQHKAVVPASHAQLDMERELRLKLGPVVENLIEAQMEQLKSELRVRLRAEMDRLIAEHIRKN